MTGRPGRRPERGGRAAVATAFVVTGCVTTSGILAERGTGTTRCYRASYDTLWPAAQAAVRRVGLVLERANRENGFLVGRSYRPPERPPEEMAVEADQGERVAVVLEVVGPDVWTVEVISRPIFRLDPTPRDWTEPVFEALGQGLPDSARAPHPELARCVAEHASPAAPDSADAGGGRGRGGPSDADSAAGAHQLGLELLLPL